MLELPPAIAPIFQDLLENPITETPETEALTNRPLWEQAIADSQAQLSISYNLKQKIAAAEAAESSMVSLEPQEAAPGDAIADEPEFISSAIVLDADFSDEPEAIAPPYELEWEEELPEELPEKLIETASPEPTTVGEAVTSLTFGVDAQEEEELWQDLAKLIDVSETAASHVSQPPVEIAAQANDQPFSNQPEAISTPGESTSTGFTLYPSWPSPTLYPLRSHKKRSSMAAVELPSFPQRRS